MLSAEYVIVKIDTDEMENGQTVADKLGGANKGLPWITILDKTGMELINSDGPGGNIGCPALDEEQAHFMSMLKKTAQKTSSEKLNEVAEALKKYAATLR